MVFLWFPLFPKASPMLGFSFIVYFAAGGGAIRKRHRWTDRNLWEIAWESSVGRERDGSDDKADGREPWEIP